jgi:hypothetical protein
MKKFFTVLILALALASAVNIVGAQGPVFCPTRPPGDNTNACASTAFVIANGGGGGGGSGLTNGSTTAVGFTTGYILAVTPAGLVGQYAINGTGDVVLNRSPTLVTPALGTPSGVVLINGTGLPISTGVSGLGTGVATFLASPTSANLRTAVTDETGSGLLVFATSPVLTTPNLGTPSAVTLTNATGLPIAGITGLGTGVGTALAVNVGTSGAFVTNGGALGTPSSGTLTNATGLPIASGVSGLGTGVATGLGITASSPGGVSITLASGTLALYTNAIATSVCETAKSASATGVLPNDVVTASFNGDVTNITGYNPTPTGTLSIYMYTTAGNVNAKVCNSTASTITPTGVTLNYRVAR